MHLVVFDIDSTLAQTMKADEDCFVRSLAEVCGIHDVDTDWSRYKYATDSGIFHEIHEVRTGRPPSPMEISQFRQHFVGLLARVSSETAFAAVAGATQLLSRLTDSAEHRVALATGAWRDSARLKMARAGLCYDDYPAASSDDAFDRESIIRLSMRRVAERYDGCSSIVYVGDGVWDARACRNVGVPFIGIATDGRASRLSEEGAVCVFPDLRDTDLFFSILHEITTSPELFPLGLKRMSPRKAIVEKYIEGFRRTDHAQILSCLTDDIVWVLHGYKTLHGKQAFHAEIENDVFKSSPVINLERLIEEDDSIAATGNGSVAKKSGEVMTFAFSEVFTFAGNLVSRLDTYHVWTK